MSGAYVPPHLRNRGDGGNQAPSSGRTVGFEGTQPRGGHGGRGGGFRRSQSVPERMTHLTDEKIREMFASIPEGDVSMQAYEGAEVRVEGGTIAPITEFPQCGLQNEILANIAELGYKSPSNVQKYSIPYVLSGQDVLVTAPTGSGKTAAYMLPVLSSILERKFRGRGPSVVVLAPVRELAQQIEVATNKYLKGTGMRTVCVFGGAAMGDQLRQLRYSCDVLVATPGRLIDILDRGLLVLADTQVLIMDEADKMLDMGFEPQIDQIINQFDMPNTESRQTLLFSATFPREVQNLARRYMRPDVSRIAVGLQDAPKLIEQRFMYCPERSKLSSLLEIIGDIDGQILIFAERKASVDRIEDYLYDQGCRVVAIHGDRDMEMRTAAMRGFSSGKAQIMVATDVAARGLDIPSVAHVINLDLPTDLDSYIHRIGRTGRAGHTGVATSFWNENNAPFLQQLCQHFRKNHQAIPEELESFDRDSRSQRGGRSGGGRGRGYNRFPRDNSYHNVRY